jgi:type IV pilus assembly protein PilC
MMRVFRYIARDATGQRHEGVRVAGVHQEVLTWLRQQELTPVAVAPAEQGKARGPRRRHRIKSAEMSAFCWQLTTMIEGGVPITSAIDTIAEDIDNSLLTRTLGHISERMQKGETFSASAGHHPKVFNQLFCAMILAGETAGTLPTVLKRLAEYYDNRDRVARKLKSALAYPAFVIAFVILIVVAVMTFIIPRFRTIFAQIGNQLPAFTQAFMAFYDVLVANLPYLLLGLAALTTTLILWGKTARGHALLSRLTLRIPLVGKLLTQMFIALFARTMATLLASGVPVLEALGIMSGMSTNDRIRHAILQARQQIVEGANIHSGLAATGFFPRMLIKMTQVGEESGALPPVLDRTSDYYERKADATVSAVMSCLEPILIVTVGAIVLVIVLALYLPVFSISNIKS